MVDHTLLARVLSEVASHLVSDYDSTELLHDLCDRTAEVLPVAGAGVMLEDDDGHLRFVAASNEQVRTIESLQVELGEGPCLQAYQTGEQVVVPDLGAGGEQFPTFADRALERGLRGVYSFPMRLAERRIGALNLYHSEPMLFSDADRAAGQVLADVATTAIMNVRTLAQSNRLVDQLQHALDSRIVVEQAKGKLCERLGISVSDAFELMRRHARSNGIRLRVVAEGVMAGELDLRAQGQMADGA